VTDDREACAGEQPPSRAGDRDLGRRAGRFLPRDRHVPRRRRDGGRRDHPPDRLEARRRAVATRLPETRAEQERDITEVVVVRASRGSIEDPAARERVSALSEELRTVGATAVVGSTDGAPLVSRDGDARAVLVGLGFDGEDDVDAVYDVVQRLDDEPGYEAAVTGEETSDADEEELSGEDLRTGELYFGLPTAVVILLLVFGAVVAGLVPLVLALVSILVALALAALVGQAFELSVYTVNMLSGMGLALGVDYSLFVVSRYREERLHGREQFDAIAASGATASRTVLFSGMTFVLAMFGLLLVPNTLFRSLAAGAILAGAVSVLAALTLLPAVLGLLGDRINAGRIPFFGRTAERAGTEGRFWGRVVHAVMRRPVVSLVLAVGFLLVLALPVLRLETGSQGASALPDRFESKQGYVLLNEEFPGRTTDPVEIAVAGDGSSARVRGAIERLEGELGRRPIFGEPEVQTSRSGDVFRLTVPIAGDPVGERAIDGVRELRQDAIPRAFADVDAEVLVTGDSAEELDYHDTVDAWTVPVFAFVLGLSFIFADDRVPLDRRAAESHRPEPAVGRRRLRTAGARVPGGDRERAARPLGGRERRGLGAAVPVLCALRTVDGLPGVPAQPHPRALSANGRQRPGGRLRGRLDRPPHHRRGAHHHRRLLGLRHGRPDHVPADGLRSRRGAPDRRDDRARGARSGGDEAAR
jgi:MMPL family